MIITIISYVFHLETIVSPTSEFHITDLLIKGKPRDVNFAGGFENSRGYVGTVAITIYNYICMVGTIESFIGTIRKEDNQQMKDSLYVDAASV